jgi:hypothetical protein
MESTGIHERGSTLGDAGNRVKRSMNYSCTLLLCGAYTVFVVRPAWVLNTDKLCWRNTEGIDVRISFIANKIPFSESIVFMLSMAASRTQLSH